MVTARRPSATATHPSPMPRAWQTFARHVIQALWTFASFLKLFGVLSYDVPSNICLAHLCPFARCAVCMRRRRRSFLPAPEQGPPLTGSSAESNSIED
jgi:hypothetical protein